MYLIFCLLLYLLLNQQLFVDGSSPFCYAKNVTSNREIYSENLGKSSITNLTKNLDLDAYLLWSPNGKRITFFQTGMKTKRYI